MALGRTSYFLIILHLINTLSAQDIVNHETIDSREPEEMSKRVPHGFVGSRGKRYFNLEQLGNRQKPELFVGTKGRRDVYEAPYLLDPGYKRAPMGFLGVRGKKDYYSGLYNPSDLALKPQGSLIGEIDYSAEQNIQNQPEFPILNELLNQYLQKFENSGTPTNEIQKRVFYAVRGKKSSGQNKRPYDLTFRGRFIGVRGKKDGLDYGKEQDDGFLLDSKEAQLKRKSQVGFFGMRGKKWTDDDSSFETEDRNE